MKRYNRNNPQTKAFDEAYYSSDDYYYLLWYDDCYCGGRFCNGYYCECDEPDYGEEGMDWYYRNREVLQRNQTINEVLGIDDGDGVNFIPLNF
jgi:hypothetical protein